MAENENPVTEPQVTQEVEPHGETDWKAEARKWEKFAKENKAARDELDALKAAQMTEQEKLVKRAEEAERQLAEANARIKHAEDVREVAQASGVPETLLEFCADREAMERFVEQYGGSAPKMHSAPTAPSSHVQRTEQTKPTNELVFAELAEQLFTN